MQIQSHGMFTQVNARTRSIETEDLDMPVKIDAPQDPFGDDVSLSIRCEHRSGLANLSWGRTNVMRGLLTEFESIPANGQSGEE